MRSSKTSFYIHYYILKIYDFKKTIQPVFINDTFFKNSNKMFKIDFYHYFTITNFEHMTSIIPFGSL